MKINTEERYNKIITNDIFLESMKLIEKYEENRKFCKHGIEHLLDVARISYIYSLEEKLNISKDIIYACALLHDIGRGKEYSTGIHHTCVGPKIAANILKLCDYKYSEIEIIKSVICSHSTLVEVTPKTLEWIITKADKESRMCFLCGVEKDCKWCNRKKTLKLVR